MATPTNLYPCKHGWIPAQGNRKTARTLPFMIKWSPEFQSLPTCLFPFTSAFIPFRVQLIHHIKRYAVLINWQKLAAKTP